MGHPAPVAGNAGDARDRAAAFASVGLDAWGCDFALLGERGNLLENPYHYRDTRTDGVMEAVTAARCRGSASTRDRRPVSAFNTLYQLYAAVGRRRV